jgi:hypothetical protein
VHVRLWPSLDLALRPERASIQSFWRCVGMKAAELCNFKAAIQNECLRLKEVKIMATFGGAKLFISIEKLSLNYKRNDTCLSG